MNYRGKLIQNESLARYTSWRVGGIADQLYCPADINDLAEFLKQLPQQEPVRWLGLGSNTLIRDGGIRGTVILTQGLLNNLELKENNIIRAEAGVACAQFARFCARNHLEGMEFLAGVPGTMGGALAMNAGAHGGETWNYVNSVEVLNRNGERHVRLASEYQVGYRSVIGPTQEWFVAGIFQLQAGDAEISKQKIRELLERRKATQPINLPNGGSVFRNPTGDYAARLIEACGLKGFKIGGARVSEKHANFIVHDGEASALDIEKLIDFVKKTVAEVKGIELIQEVHVIGEY